MNDSQINCQNKNFKKTVQQCAAKTNLKMLKKDQMSTCCVSLSQNRKANIVHNDRALCRCGIRIPSARNHSLAFDKDKCLEPMFGDAGQARTKAAMLMMPIATTSSRTCTKPIVACWRSFWWLSSFMSKLLSKI